VLPAAHRLRRPADFRRVVRTGARAGRSTVVVHALVVETSAPTRVGFVVSKAVGNAVVRNLVERRLRAAVMPHVTLLPTSVEVVVRALPAAAEARFSTLVTDLEGAWSLALHRARSVANDRNAV
jgi:ribonuclease P protein component